MSAADSFQIRVTNAFKGTYQTSMRRSFQSVALFEADRCLKQRYPELKPFQKKYALYATAIDLLGTVDFLNDYHRQEIMFRTNSSKEPLAPGLAWRRMKLIPREIKQIILPKAKELLEDDINKEKSHEEFCEVLLQKMFEEKNGGASNKAHPAMWEYNHNNVFTVYRIYFRGVSVDPNIFPPKIERVVAVPMKKSDISGGSNPLAHMNLTGKSHSLAEDERRAMLKEVKDHTELLKEFEGIIPEDELLKRKRALYDALPPVPPPFVGPVVVVGGGGKRQKKKVKAEPGKLPVLPGTSELVAAAAQVALGPSVDATAMEEETEDWVKVGAHVKEEGPAKFLTEV